MTRCRYTLRLGLTGVLILTAGAGVRADTIYDNFGPDDGYDFRTAWTIGLGFPVIDQGEPFTVSGGRYRLDAIELALQLAEGDNAFDLWLMTDDGGEPGRVIEAFHVVGALGPTGHLTPPVRVASELHPVLKAGTRYWLVASATVDTYASWCWNATGDVGPHAQRRDGGPWNVTERTRGAFRVSGTPVWQFRATR